MPTRAMSYGRNSYSWTDDLPVCHMSGVGTATNKLYQDNGMPVEEHEFEDFCFRLKSNSAVPTAGDGDARRAQIDGETCLYGVFDGNEGTAVASFAYQRMPAEILLGQFNVSATEEEIRALLRQAFLSVEKGYFESIDDKLAERTNLMIELPSELTSYEQYKRFPDLIDRLSSLNADVASGSTAAIALVANDRLYVANVGDSRVLLCRTDQYGVMTVVQLSIDHNLRNEDELLRLARLGLDVDKLRQGIRLGNHDITRCLGNFMAKGGYREFEFMRAATAEPVTSEPEIHGPVEIDANCRFLMLLSNGLYRSLEESTGSQQANKDIAQMVVEQFRVQATITAVSQAVVDQISRIHQDAYSNSSARSTRQRQDMTLLIRNFNYPLSHGCAEPQHVPNRLTPVASQRFLSKESDGGSTLDGGSTDNLSMVGRLTSATAVHDTSTETPNAAVAASSDHTATVQPPQHNNVDHHSRSAGTGVIPHNNSQAATQSEGATNTTESSSGPMQSLANSMSLDIEGKVAPYVDFTEFYQHQDENNRE